MSGWAELIAELAETARREAAAAPELVADLARLEQYVAESYHQRTIAELIQNADDADATCIECVVRDSYIIFSNNGRLFTENDFRSICRSGASLKQTENGRIGYRGIGFKSTINLADRIHVVSGDLAFTFSRDLTQAALCAKQVPAVRMPHPLAFNQANGIHIDADIRDLSTRGQRTFFILEAARCGRAKEELTLLTGDSLLFLRSLRSVSLQAGQNRRHIMLSRLIEPVGSRVEVTDGAGRANWMAFSHPSNPSISLAFPLDPDGCISPCPTVAQPLHCFLPTAESTGYGFRANADFTTDPSRLRVDLDDRSNTAIGQLAEAVIELLRQLAMQETLPAALPGLFGVLANPVGFSRIGELLRAAIHSAASSLAWLPGGTKENLGLRARPDWLAPEDYSEIAGGNYGGARAIQRMDNQCPQFMKFLAEVGIPQIDDDAVATQCERLSDIGKVNLARHLVRKLRGTGSATEMARFENLALWRAKDGRWCTVLRAKRGLEPTFQKLVATKLSEAELQWLDRKWSLGIGPVTPDPVPVGCHPVPLTSSPVPETKRPVYGLKRWRRSEENLRQILVGRLGAVVHDVSQANLGYDLEVEYPDGRKDYVEVKDVGRERGEFALTNNEYAHATSLGEGYVLAVCSQSDDGFAWALIRNPVNNLILIKRCRQWEWACTDAPPFTDHEILG